MRGIGKHVAVVRDVHIQKAFGWPEDLPVTLICFDCLYIGIDGLQPPPGANVDMRRHMHIVREAGL